MLYFGKQKLMRHLGQESEGLKKALTVGAQEIATARLLVHSLEQQLAQRNDEMNMLKSMAKQQEKDLRLLQERAEERLNSVGRPLPTPAESKLEESQAPLGVKQEFTGSVQEIPLWRENLDNILSTLDKMEKGTEK
jgi:chromosome segregation ATPase